MELLEITEKHTMRREQAADLLRELADALSRHNGVDFLREGKKLHIRVPDEVEVELEVEIESGESGIEIEINW
ncbi:amphi-Trp domain-containing protein [Parahaliea mediterranea]|uniref:Amphi-Trp domain-containing protein n=1 Tax=Parahaliea mediterranea TaxID=651086 RepID=A0A939IN91_9GAMM|nr:amphi-Trp domain-containing protein [Parahaliea mediterranea]MBN7797807.1 amphi-Trp domain-containing protein [Parahaliea mediterranea]